MENKLAATILSVLVVVFGALAAYGECSQLAAHHEFGAEHEAPSIHCPDALLISNIRVASTVQSYRKNLSEIPPHIDEKIDKFVSVDRIDDHPFREPFSHQGLFRFEEVYRL